MAATGKSTAGGAAGASFDTARLNGLAADWGWILAAGILTVILGALAISVPHVFTVGITIFLGAFLLVSGLSEVVRAFRHTKLKGWWWWLIAGVLYAVAGGILLFRPDESALTLTLVLAALFFVRGIFTIAYSFSARPLPNWGWVLLSGLASIVVGILLWAGWPASGMWAIGLLVGIDLIFSGWSLVTLAFAAKAQAG